MSHLLFTSLIKPVSCEEYCRSKCEGNDIVLVYMRGPSYGPLPVQALMAVLEAGLTGLPVPIVITRLQILVAHLLGAALERLPWGEVAEIVARVVCEPFGDEEDVCLSMVKPQLETILEIAKRAEKAVEEGRDAGHIVDELKRELNSLTRFLLGSETIVTVEERASGNDTEANTER